MKAASARSIWGSVLTVLGAQLMGGCASAPELPKPPAPVSILLAIVSAQDANPDLSGRPSPVVVRVFQLTDAAAFQEASFDALAADANATLKGALKGESRATVRPGELVDLPMALAPETRVLGFVAEYTDLLGAVWRVTLGIPADAAGSGLAREPVKLTVTRAALRIEPQR